MTESSLPTLLQERASEQPDATANTFIDYEISPAGFAESLTWSQVHRREITGGRVAAISVPNDRTEELVAIVEFKNRGGSDEYHRLRLRSAKRDVTSAISNSHQLRVVDLVLVPPGSIPIRTSGNVRRSACVERYRQDEFERLDVSA